VQRKMLSSVEHQQQKYQNIAENLHQPTRLQGKGYETVQVSKPGSTFALARRNQWLSLRSRETSVPSYCLPESDEVEIQCLGRAGTRRPLAKLVNRITKGVNLSHSI
jgi:hypothetical protein